jgi:lipopolysaccharide transport system permease protein
MSALGVAFWLSALNVAFRDITQLLPFLSQLWMFGSPIIYPSALIPEAFRLLYFLNPVALVVEGFRWAIANAPPPPLEAWLVGSGVAVLLLASGYLFFRRREPYFADII